MIRFDADEGSFLNGKSIKLKDVCSHKDHGGVDVAVHDRVQYYRIEMLKEMIINAYRCAHNWMPPEVLEACDQLGMLVIDEVRMTDSTEELSNQLETMVRLDRNHPSIIKCCLGN